jgi:hypothetical protein
MEDLEEPLVASCHYLAKTDPSLDSSFFPLDQSKPQLYTPDLHPWCGMAMRFTFPHLEVRI